MNYEKEKTELMLHYKLKDVLTAELADSIVTDVKAELAKDAAIEAVVIDLHTHKIENKAFKTLCPFGLELMKSKSHIYIISEQPAVHKLIKSEAMDKMLTPISSVRAIRFSNAAPQKIDVSFVNPFIEGTIHVLKIQCHTEVSPGKPSLKSKSGDVIPLDIAGIIGLTSAKFNGSIALGFPKEVFLGIMSQMLGEDYKEITDELQDGAGELLNMIFGHAKKVLNESGHSLEMALPTIARGTNLSINHSNPYGGAIVIPFSTPNGKFVMEIGAGKPITKKETPNV